jgi:hypothetical protein
MVDTGEILSCFRPQRQRWFILLGLFKLGMELVRLGEQFLAPVSDKLCRWVRDKLSYLRPTPPTYKLRYLQHRVVVP